MVFARSIGIRISSAIAIGAITLASVPALASQISIKPIVVVMNSHNRTSTLEFENTADKNLRLQVTAYRWTQGKYGVDEMVPTDDIVVFPTLLAIAKGQHRSVRIGTTVSSGITEATYRLVIEELPEAQSDALPFRRAATVARTKIVMAAFVSPVKPEPKAALDGVALTHGTMHVHFLNPGNAHYVVQKIMVSGSDAGDGSVFAAPLVSGYVLPGADQEVTYQVLRSNCARLRHIDVNVTTSVGELKERLPVSPEQCK